MPHPKRYLTGLLIAIGLLWISADPAPAAILGDPAPPLQVTEWIQGEPVRIGDGKTIAVIEFWSTNCPYCLDTIPLLSDLQEKFKPQHVRIVGLTREEGETVRGFLSEEGEDIRYGIARDAESRTKEAYMSAFGVDGIPHAFIVDPGGRVVWEGHPKQGLEKALTEMIAGTYDLDAALQEKTARALFAAYEFLAERTRETDLVARIGKRLLAAAADHPDLLMRTAKYISTSPQIGARDLDLALAAAERAYAIAGADDPTARNLYAAILVQAGQKEKAVALFKKQPDAEP